MKRALIVDDSRLARAALSRLLVEHGVEADTAESAEVALEYLKHSRPDVVFLDHMMPGIDGFQALEAIKTNPATATIPVMMYTSQEGELYVGQARALGALGVLPKTVQQVEVGKVLRSLHLIPTEPTSRAPAAASASASATADLEPLDAQRLRTLLAELFAEHTTALRGELRREWQRIAAAAPSPAAQPVPPPPLDPPPALEAASQAAGVRAFKLASALLVVIAAVLAYLWWATNASLERVTARTARLAEDAAALTAASSAVQPPPAAPATAVDETLDVLEWGLNQGGRYPFGAVPLGDDRAAVLESLIAKLEKLEFAGTIAFDVHVGRFCMNYGADGTLEPAPAEQPAATCERIGWPEADAVAMGRQESRAFANVVATATADNPLLKVETVSHGTTEPVVDYPIADYGLTAGAWNAVAAANQRIGVRLIPTPAAAAAARR